MALFKKISELLESTELGFVIETVGGVSKKFNLGNLGKKTQYETLPSASENAGKIFQYVGETNENYTNGMFYVSLENGQGQYEWFPSSIMQKVANATTGDIATLDETGNVTDSGIASSNVMQKVGGATNGNVATLNASGEVIDSGINLNKKVNVAHIDVSNQSITILQLVKNLFTDIYNRIDYARWFTVSDGTANNITDKPVSGKGFICEARISRASNQPTFSYILTCWVRDEAIPYFALVTSETSAITWLRSPDTKNTAGSTDSSSKLYLVGATSQEANPQTYSDDEVYVQDGVLEAKEVQVNSAAKFVWDSTNQCLKVVFN